MVVRGRGHRLFQRVDFPPPENRRPSWTPYWKFRLTFIWHGRIFDFGLFRVDFGVPSNRAVFRPTEDIHEYLAYALFALAGIHAAAALWHHFFMRNGVLGRMWPMSEGAGTPVGKNLSAE
jgi:hypothetical protein